MATIAVLKEFNAYRIVYVLDVNQERFFVEKRCVNALGEAYYCPIEIFNSGIKATKEDSLERRIYYEWFMGLLKNTFALCKKTDDVPRVMCTFGREGIPNEYRIIQLSNRRRSGDAIQPIKYAIESLLEDAMGVKAYAPLLRGYEFEDEDDDTWTRWLFEDLRDGYLSGGKRKGWKRKDGSVS